MALLERVRADLESAFRIAEGLRASHPYSQMICDLLDDLSKARHNLDSLPAEESKLDELEALLHDIVGMDDEGSIRLPYALRHRLSTGLTHICKLRGSSAPQPEVKP